MSGASMPPDRVPTLTEVVSWPQAPASAPPLPSESQLPLPSVEADVVTLPPQVLRIADEEMVQGVLVEVQRQVELMLDYRLREALTPLLARAADSIVRDARTELASTLRDVVARAVAEELARHRTR